MKAKIRRKTSPDRTCVHVYKERAQIEVDVASALSCLLPTRGQQDVVHTLTDVERN